MSTENGTPSNHAIPYFICQPSVPVGVQTASQPRNCRTGATAAIGTRAELNLRCGLVRVGTVKLRGRIMRRYIDLVVGIDHDQVSIVLPSLLTWEACCPNIRHQPT